MRHPRIVLACVLAAWVPITAGGSLSPSLERVTLEGEELSSDARFARIDSLTARLDELEGVERSRTAYRLGQLYLATGLAKHRRTALEYLDRAIADDPSFFEAARLRATTAHQMRYAREAWHWLEELVERRPDDPRGYELLGQFHFEEAKRVLDAKRFARARDAFARSVAVDSLRVGAWLGLAASSLALEDYESLLEAGSAVARFEDHELEGLLLQAAACAELGHERRAHDLFREACGAMPAAARAVFEEGDGFLTPDTLPEELVHAIDPQALDAAMRALEEGWQTGDEVDFSLALRDSTVRRQAVEAYWDAANRWPSRQVNKRKLRFWKRLVEADVLFGDPESGGRGWDTEMGMVLVRWGRPDFMIYEPPSTAIDLEHWYARGVRLSFSDVIPSQTALWVWTYQRDSTWFSLLFTDPTYQARWRASSRTAENIRALSRAAPLAFFDAEPPPEFYLSFETAVFPRGSGTMVENYVAIQPTRAWNELMPSAVPAGAPDPAPDEASLAWATVELAIYDGDGEALEYASRELDALHLRSALHRALGVRTFGTEADPLLCQISAQLPPGRYRLGLDVTVPGNGHRGLELELMLPEPAPPGVLSLSDLQLASAFEGYRPGVAVPREFVKYAHAVVPSPGSVFPRDATRLHVYFEVRNLRTDDAGRTRFNVSYEVYRQKPGGSIRQAGRDLDPEILAAMEPVGLTFVEESTGVSADDLVVKGGEVSIESLAPGRYVLVVKVEDLRSGQVTSRYTPFVKSRT